MPPSLVVHSKFLGLVENEFKGLKLKTSRVHIRLKNLHLKVNFLIPMPDLGSISNTSIFQIGILILHFILFSQSICNTIFDTVLCILYYNKVFKNILPKCTNCLPWKTTSSPTTPVSKLLTLILFSISSFTSATSNWDFEFELEFLE